MKKNLLAAITALMMVMSVAPAADNNASVWSNVKTWAVEKKQEVQDINWTEKKEQTKEAVVIAVEKTKTTAKKVKDAAVDLTKKTKEGITDAYHQYQEKKEQKEEKEKQK